MTPNEKVWQRRALAAEQRVRVMRAALRLVYPEVAGRNSQGKVVAPSRYAAYSFAAIDARWDHRTRHIAHQIAKAITA